MELVESIKVALQALKTNKLRSALTMLGIIIGVAAVVALISVGMGAKNSITASVQGLGSNLIIVIPGTEETERTGMAMDPTVLKMSDVDAILKQSRLIRQASPLLSRAVTISYKGRSKVTTVYAANEKAAEIMNFPIEKGRGFSKSDVLNMTKVTLIGPTIEKDIFKGEDPIGKYIKIENQNFKVIGVTRKKGATLFGTDQDDQLAIPITTAQKKLFGVDYVDMIQAQVIEESQIEVAMAEVEEILRKEHQLSGNDPNDFLVRSQAQLLDIVSTITNILTILLGSIAGISLLVGGIGIMNIMLVSVTERTREIGIRKAVGAKRRDILYQFLVESVVLSVTGGVVGILLGWTIASAISRFANIPATVTAGSVLLAFVFSASVGLFFGIYPALRAARLHPIEALRYE